jgi:superfamily II DNA or RNA helicase
MYSLREYQEQAVEAIREFYRRQKKRVILYMATGAGKTVVASHVIFGASSKGNRTLFLAHRRELIKQCSNKLDEMGIPHGIIMGNHPVNPRAMVQVGSVATCVNRELGEFGLIIIDECHHARSDSYHKIIDRYPNAAVIGLTATPYRLDGKGLGVLFNEIITVKTVRDLISDGFLTPFRVFAPSIIDTTGWKITGGDFNKKFLEEHCQTPKIYGDIVRDWMAHGRGRPTVMFAASVKQSEDLVAAFRAVGVSAVHVDALTPADKRDSALAALGSGSVEIVSNVGILTEGWDCPPASCAILARPTASLQLHIQMIGRILRTFKGKIDALVLDHAGNHFRHGFVTDDREISLDGVKKREKKTAGSVGSVRTCPKCYLCMPSGTFRCSGCGHEFKPDERKIKVVASDLKELKPWEKDMGRTVDPEAPKEPRYKSKSTPEEYYAKMALAAREKGYSIGWAKHRFHAVFGYYPTFSADTVKTVQSKLPKGWSW